jgi:hypothetical protein
VKNEYLLAVQDGATTQALSVIGSLNFIILITWLMICGSISESTFRRSRLPVFVCIACISLWNLLYTRSIGVLGSISVGLNAVLCTITAINFVLLHDPRSFQRLILSSRPEKSETDAYNGNSSLIVVWEPMPKSILRRSVWVLDLLSGFRGVHWFWGSFQSTPKLPSPRNLYLSQNSTTLRNVLHFVVDYLFIDLAKCLMIIDPYFIGYKEREPPSHISSYITSPLGLYTYHILLAAAGVFLAVDLISSFAKLVQVNILGPKILGLNAFPALFPPVWGSPKAVLRKGLRGFWGETWHQMFRKQFVSIGDAIADWVLGHEELTLEARKESKIHEDRSRLSSARQIIRVSTVFLLGGVLHAAASYTLLGHTKPWASFLFFALQPFGLAVQSTCSQVVVVPYLSNRLSLWQSCLRQCSNLAFTILWLWATSGLLLTDLTSGGVWIFEPVPVSLIRGSGLSKGDQRLWCW